MNQRLPLFGKIFLGFWLVTIAALGGWMLASHYFDTGPDRDELARRPHGPPQRFILRMVYDLQNLDESGLRALLARAGTEHQIDIYLLDLAGADLLGRTVPANVTTLAQQLRGPRRRAFVTDGRERLLAHQIYRSDRGALRAVFVFHPSRHLILGLLGSHLWLRIGMAILISGVACYLLSRLLTKRIKDLQVASRQLAEGELDTRLQVRSRGGDETDELARDFNSMAQQLQERIEAQKRLLIDVSHELRSPLARLRIALALAQDNPAGTAGYLQRIENETERLEALIGQLMASHGGELTLDDHVDLVPLLQQLCGDANFEGAAQKKAVVLTHSVPEAIVASSGDLLRKSMENVLRNALAHTAAGSVVKVTLQQTLDENLVRVTDEGSGVPESELEKIFETFYRTDMARSRELGGHGLGLAIARGAILRHGGRIWAENTATGLSVTLSLPRQYLNNPA